MYLNTADGIYGAVLDAGGDFLVSVLRFGFELVGVLEDFISRCLCFLLGRWGGCADEVIQWACEVVIGTEGRRDGLWEPRGALFVTLYLCLGHLLRGLCILNPCLLSCGARPYDGHNLLYCI